jgi:hypothetical protein
MSALPSKADIIEGRRYVGLVPLADIIEQLIRASSAP